MKKKVLIGSLSAILVLGGAFAVGASKNDSGDDTIHLDDKKSVVNVDSQNLPEISAGQEIEIEEEHGQTYYKIESDDDDDDDDASSTNSSSHNTELTVEEAAKIATNEVNGKITKVEKEMEHGRLEYKFEIQSNQGEADVRVDAESGKITRVKYDDSDDRYDDDDDDDDDKK